MQTWRHFLQWAEKRGWARETIDPPIYDELPSRTQFMEELVKAEDFGGYKCEFVSGGSTPPNHLACSLCTFLLRDPCLVDCCGAKYCETCVNHLREDGQPCNVCKKQLGNAEPDAKLKRLVVNQKVNIICYLLYVCVINLTLLHYSTRCMHAQCHSKRRHLWSMSTERS